MLTGKLRHWLPTAFSFFFLFGCLLPLPARAGKDLVDCRYLSSSGTEIRLQIAVSSPPPTTLIIIQNIPEGRIIASASPGYNKYNEKRGEAKWLLKGVAPGSFVLAIRLDQPIGAGEINGEIRYKNPVTGQMVSMPTRP
ncbi:hypothetical protein ACUUL3_06780 [Thiovibrio sp. JS02]